MENDNGHYKIPNEDFDALIIELLNDEIIELKKQNNNLKTEISYLQETCAHLEFILESYKHGNS